MLLRYDLKLYYREKQLTGVQSFEVYLVDKDLLGVRLKRYINLEETVNAEDLELVEEDGYVISEVMTDMYGAVLMELDKLDRDITACSLSKEEKGE